MILMKQNIVKNKDYYKNLSYKELFLEYKKIEKSSIKNQCKFINNISDEQLVNISVFYLGFIPWYKNLSIKRYHRIYLMYMRAKKIIKLFENSKTDALTPDECIDFLKLNLNEAMIGYNQFKIDIEIRKNKNNILKIKQFTKKCERYNKYKVFS